MDADVRAMVENLQANVYAALQAITDRLDLLENPVEARTPEDDSEES